MQDPNYRCPCCNKEFFYQTTVTSFSEGRLVTKSEGKEIVCDICEDHPSLVNIPKKFEYGRPLVSTRFSKMTMSEIETDRKQRSHEDFKKNVLPTMDREAKAHHLKKNPSLKKYL